MRLTFLPHDIQTSILYTSILYTYTSILYSEVACNTRDGKEAYLNYIYTL